MEENSSPKSNGIVQKQEPSEAEGEKSKLPRHPRWTIHDTITLIQAKQAVENRGTKYRMGSVFGPDEPKWDAISSLCKQEDVERGPAQCRKRWGNLVCDFRKVKTWESQVIDEADSYWVMRSDARRDKKLPGFFDKEIYDLLDGGNVAATAYPLRSIKEDPNHGHEEDENEKNQDESVSRNYMLIIKENGGDSGTGNNTREPSPDPIPIPTTDTAKEKDPSTRGPDSQEGKKRKCTSSNEYEGTSLGKRLSEVIEKNFTMMNAQLEAQNMNTQLDREEKKERDGNLFGVLTKIADALGKIADKL